MSGASSPAVGFPPPSFWSTHFVSRDIQQTHGERAARRDAHCRPRGLLARRRARRVRRRPARQRLRLAALVAPLARAGRPRPGQVERRLADLRSLPRARPRRLRHPVQARHRPPRERTPRPRKGRLSRGPRTQRIRPCRPASNAQRPTPNSQSTTTPRPRSTTFSGPRRSNARKATKTSRMQTSSCGLSGVRSRRV